MKTGFFLHHSELFHVSPFQTCSVVSSLKVTCIFPPFQLGDVSVRRRREIREDLIETPPISVTNDWHLIGDPGSIPVGVGQQWGQARQYLNPQSPHKKAHHIRRRQAAMEACAYVEAEFGDMVLEMDGLEIEIKTGETPSIRIFTDTGIFPDNAVTYRPYPPFNDKSIKISVSDNN